MQPVKGLYVVLEQVLTALGARSASHFVHSQVPQEVAQEICGCAEVAAV